MAEIHFAEMAANMTEIRFAEVPAASWQDFGSRVHPGLAILAVTSVPFVLTYAFTLLKSFLLSRTSKAAEEPHTVPYVLPWLGNFPSFMFNSRRYQLALQ
jgi:hypothetical protein